MAKEFDKAEWKWWQAALEAKRAGRAKIAIGSDDIPIIPGQPMQGYYRFPTHPGGPKIPVAYWYDEDGLHCLINNVAAEGPAARGRWTHAAKDPITHAEYSQFIAAMDAGEDPVWSDEVKVEVNGVSSSSQVKSAEPAEVKQAAEEAPAKKPRATRKKKDAEPQPVVEEVSDEISDELDDDPVPVAAPAKASRDEAREIAASMKKGIAKTDTPAPVAEPEPAKAEIGHNSGDSFSQWRDEVQEWQRVLTGLIKAGTPKTKEDADKIADAQSKLREILAKGDKDRLDETKPLRDEVAEINARYKAISDEGDKVRRRPTRRSTHGTAAVRRQRQEEDRVRREEEAAERARQAAAAAESDELEDETPAPAPAAAPVVEEKVHVGTRRTSTTFKQKVVVIDDVLLVGGYFLRQDPPHPDLMDVIRKLAHRAMVNAGVTIEGAHIEEKEGRR